MPGGIIEWKCCLFLLFELITYFTLETATITFFPCIILFLISKRSCQFPLIHTYIWLIFYLRWDPIDYYYSLTWRTGIFFRLNTLSFIINYPKDFGLFISTVSAILLVRLYERWGLLERCYFSITTLSSSLSQSRYLYSAVISKTKVLEFFRWNF